MTVNPGKGDYSANSIYGSGLTEKQRKEVQTAVTYFFNKYITSDMSAIEKLFIAQNYMSATCVYAEDGGKSGVHTAWGALVYKNAYGKHEAQCSGYSKGFKALCDAMNIPCRYVVANSKSYNPNHQWCMVQVDGSWYIIDPQGNATDTQFFGDVYPSYFLLGKSSYCGMTGMAWDVAKYPAVSQTDYNKSEIIDKLSVYRVDQALLKIWGNSIKAP